ncbi:HAD-IC family P-type ATPase [Arthrobacter hankyongi]|uniref:HAD-IC family P-type ATPase n=1 Tax=Arthrobacter hankyongi TaxID=2904801 RepID=UPI0027DEC0E8|nr:HAD-IC family P-type ATPase [Arthrobacter hankyongi]
MGWAARAASRGKAVLRHDEWIAEGDPMEAALDALARRLAGPQGPEPAAVDTRWAFDAVRRRESVVVGSELLLKGAPESVLPLCDTDTDLDEASGAVESMASRGLRVLAIDARRIDGTATGPQEWPARPEQLEAHLRLLGLVGLHHPPRPSVAAALRSARTAGIKVAMVTGDHQTTAAAIAREIGLLGPDRMVLEGQNLPGDDHVLGAMLDRDGVVVSRVSPEQKLRVARALQLRGHVLAMTGDGVNDGPALQEADIGVAMGASGTDVAREAADLVLLDDDFATIITAVEQGRATYANIRRFLTYHLTDNVAELTPS